MAMNLWRKNATKKGYKQKGGLGEYLRTPPLRVQTEAECSNSSLESWKIEQKQEEEIVDENSKISPKESPCEEESSCETKESFEAKSSEKSSKKVRSKKKHSQVTEQEQ